MNPPGTANQAEIGISLTHALGFERRNETKHEEQALEIFNTIRKARAAGLDRAADIVETAIQNEVPTPP
jgi:hypothetical protein